MPRTAAQIQAEIDTIETLLSSAEGLYSSAGADGVSRSINRAELSRRLDQLYMQLGRANGTSPMIVRGRVDGLRNSVS